jgi:Cu2+-exporting ATPase
LSEHEHHSTEGAEKVEHQAGGSDHQEHAGQHGGGPSPKPAGHGGDSGHHDHHAHMVADFRRRFWVCLFLTVPVLALAPMIQRLLGVEETLAFPGDSYLQFAISSAVFFYGGWPFLSGFFGELRKRQPGMMFG